MEKAYEKAKEGGYEGRVYAPSHSAELLDPKFWQALGKSLGWKEEQERELFYIRLYKNIEIREDVSGGWVPESLYHWHRFIDSLAEGKSPDSFFEELLKLHDTTL